MRAIDRGPARLGAGGLYVKLLGSFLVVSLLPVGVMVALARRHLDRIQETSVRETQAALVSAEMGRLRERLLQEADRLASFFSRVQGETRTLRSFAQSVLATPAHFTYRNGSRYLPDGLGGYGNPADDGNSALSAPRFSPALAPVVSATESLDLIMRPLAAQQPRMALAWVIGAEGFARAFPWRDFRPMPRDRDYTSWPFYFLADPARNPSRREVFTNVYLDPLSGDWMISCLSPVYVRGRHRATAGIDITIQSLLREIRDIRVFPRSGSLLLSGTEVIAASEGLASEGLGLPPGRYPVNLTDSKFASVRQLADTLGRPGPRVEALELGSRRALAAHAPVEPPGWRLVLLAPEEEVNGPGRTSAEGILAESGKLRSNFVHILAFSLAGVVAVSWLAFVYQARGLRRLLTGIRALGNGDLSHRLAEGGGEFGSLAHALNSTAESLQEQGRELRRVSLEMEQGRRLAAVGTLAAGVAHEVNNPLATISTYAQMLLRREDLPADAAHDLGIVMDEIRRIQEKLRSLLDLSRLQSPTRVPLDPNSLVDEVVGLLRHEAATRGIEVRVEEDPALGDFPLDRSGIKQVLWNLLTNARDAQGPGGLIAVRTRAGGAAGGSLVLEVEDRGPGIPEELLARVFEPFFTTKEVGVGTGLGLALAYAVVRSHGGRIEARNLDGGGCRFRVEIPREEAP